MRSLALAIFLILWPAVLPAQPSNGSDPGTAPGSGGGSLGGALDFGFGLQVDRPYQEVGGTAEATLFFFNMTSQDADGAWANPGGFGCRYHVVVRDAKGRLVWRPQTLCPLDAAAPIGPFPFPGGTLLQLPATIPLVYRGSEISVPDGTPLPGGAYTLEARHDYAGPVHPEGPQTIGLGGVPEATVPIRLVECRTPAPLTVVESLDQGEISGYRYADDEFYGEDFVLRTREEAAAFWKAHTSHLFPRPKPPEVNWEEEMVLATVMGFQTTGGGPSTTITDVIENRCHIEVQVTEAWIPGPLDVITNPYHLVKIPRSLKEVTFTHHVVVP